jgi:hypothetical protein
VRLRRAEKSAGTTKWALSGAGAKRKPPTPEQRKHLKAKLERELALVRESPRAARRREVKKAAA